MDTFAPELLKFVQIIWINIVLSGDNAVVIALACRGLPQHRQRAGMFFGALVAVALRIVFTVVVASLLSTPLLKIAGGGLLLWIAVKLVAHDDDEGSTIGQTDRIWQAVRTIAIADAVMSLDNVVAIAAVAKDSTVLLIAGLAISIPLIIAGATLIMALLSRFPVLVWAGAALLGWVAGEMLVSDIWLAEQLGAALVHRIETPAAVMCVALVIGLGFVLNHRSRETSSRQEATERLGAGRRAS
jgi:YjbE family integral membrane protein